MVFKPQTFLGKEPNNHDGDSGSNATAELEARVADALARAADLDPTSISVTVVGSHVVLHGTVMYPEEVDIAEDIASRIPGVLTIDNRLTATGKMDEAIH